LELACGCGQGLGYLASFAAKVIGGDYSEPLLRMAHRHYLGRIQLVRLDAQQLPFRERTFDTVILYEAIYYLKDCANFVGECTRVLRPGGNLLICSANKDLPDFNPSPHSYRYFSPPHFTRLLVPYGFKIECYGDFPVDYGTMKQRALSFIKQVMVCLHFMPKTMAGKRLFKRLVFGRLVPMPAELEPHIVTATAPSSIATDKPDTIHKVILVAARLAVKDPT
jgi:SAM-dependent methyltransferase